jgi:murein DD-endopeptidase MepM/ murein hydrolase activator NlpD
MPRSRPFPATALLFAALSSFAVATALDPPQAGLASASLRSGADGAGAVAGTITSRRLLLWGPRPQRLTVRTPEIRRPVRVAIELVPVGSDRLVARWDLDELRRGSERTITWDGKVLGGPATAEDGRYHFRASVDGGKPVDLAEPFDVVRGFFPVRGPHTYGDGLGAGRGHQGQDVLAACGTPLVAARGGRIVRAGWSGGGGNTIVLDVDGSPVLHTYLHMLAPALVAEGEHVVTGQHLGLVGSTGHSTACHLHFEVWSPPGPYIGGTALDPTAPLTLWDRQTGAGLTQGPPRPGSAAVD